MVSIKDYKVDSDVSVGGATIKAITDGDEEEDVSIIGHLISYTIGSDFAVPRTQDATGANGQWEGIEWGLEERMEELDLFIAAPDGTKQLMIPPKVTPKRAFNRVRDRLIPELTANHGAFYGEGRREVGGRVTRFEAKKATNDEWHVTAEAYFTADELNASSPTTEHEDGEFRQTTVMVCRYDDDNDALVPYGKVEQGDPLWDTWELLAEQALGMFEEMQEANVGRDIQKMLNRFTHHWTDTIKVRDGGAVYFVPAGYDAIVRSLKTLIDEIDAHFKNRGRDCELLRISVTDAEEERQQIEAKARKHIEGQVEDALEMAFEALSDDETVAEDIAEDLQDRLKGLDSFAGDYNALLSAKLSAQEVLKERLSELEGEKEALVEQALEGEEAPVA